MCEAMKRPPWRSGIRSRYRMPARPVPQCGASPIRVSTNDGRSGGSDQRRFQAASSTRVPFGATSSTDAAGERCRVVAQQAQDARRTRPPRAPGGRAGRGRRSPPPRARRRERRRPRGTRAARVKKASVSSSFGAGSTISPVRIPAFRPRLAAGHPVSWPVILVSPSRAKLGAGERRERPQQPGRRGDEPGLHPLRPGGEEAGVPPGRGRRTARPSTRTTASAPATSAASSTADEADRRPSPASSGRPLREIGFAILEGHGIEPRLYDEAEARGGRALHATCRLEEKMRFRAQRHGSVNQGYFPIKETSDIHPDLVEGWVFCRRAFDMGERAATCARRGRSGRGPSMEPVFRRLCLAHEALILPVMQSLLRRPRRATRTSTTASSPARTSASASTTTRRSAPRTRPRERAACWATRTWTSSPSCPRPASRACRC